MRTRYNERKTIQFKKFRNEICYNEEYLKKNNKLIKFNFAVNVVKHITKVGPAKKQNHFLKNPEINTNDRKMT